jgi:hypothetical protein
MNINKKTAAAVLREEAELVRAGAPLDNDWVSKVERVSKLCEEGAPATHIAFLGTSMLARATEANADLFHIKPKHSKDNPYAYSARTLSEKVLVPLSAEFGFSLGVTKRQPLNNQPYYRMVYLGDDTPIQPGAGQAIFDYVIELINELAPMQSDQARQALRAFIAVRLKYQRQYAPASEGIYISADSLPSAIRDLVAANSEKGKRAQAAVAGLLDVIVGEDRVESTHIHDPSRHYPGDVAILSPGETDVWEKSFEVRDKPVSDSDITLFARMCADSSVPVAAMVMVAAGQNAIDSDRIRAIGDQYSIYLMLFHGWDGFVEQCLFWAPIATSDAAESAVEAIRERLIAIEASPEAVSMWDKLTRLSADPKKSKAE